MDSTDLSCVSDRDEFVGWELGLVAASTDEPSRLIRFLSGALMACGAWIVMRRFQPDGTAQLEFEFARASCVEIYAVLIAAGVELSRDSHMRLTELCQCTKHVIETKAFEVVHVELAVLIVAGAGTDVKSGDVPRRLT
jgi:hypothetical protein